MTVPHRPWWARLATSAPALWCAAVVVHVGVVALAVGMNQHRGDIALYAQWAQGALHGGRWPVLTDGWEYASWVYPVLALVPVVLAGLVGDLVGSYAVGWYVVACTASLLATWSAADHGRRPRGGWYWLAFITFVGVPGLSRLDIFAALSVVLALRWAARRPWAASLALTVGAWIKVAPGLVVVALFAAVRRRWREVVLPAAVLSLAVLAAVAALGGGLRSLSFLSQQSARGLQAETPAAGVVLLVARLTGADVRVVFDPTLITHEVRGSAVADALARASTPLMLAAVLAAGVMVWLARRRPADALLWGALAVLVSAIVLNKVGSPQFHVWLAAPLAVAVAERWHDRRWRLAAAVGLVDAVATFVVYPLLFTSLVGGSAWGLAALTVRTVAVLVLGGVAFAGLAGTVRAARADALAPLPAEQPAGQPQR